MTLQQWLTLCAVLAVQSLGGAQTTRADATVAQSIKEAVSAGRLTKIEGGDLKLEYPVSVPGKTPKTGGAETEVLYQIGVTTKDRTPVFLPVRTAPSASAETGKVIEDALSRAKLSAGDVDVQACSGGRSCVKVCGSGPSEYCCKWRCETNKQH